MSDIIFFMALFIRQDEERTELQKKLATELQDRIKEKPKFTESPDGVDDSEYIKGTKITTSLAWVWTLIVLVAIGIMIWLVVLSLK